MRKREKSEKGEKRINFLLILIILILLAALGVVAYKGFTVKQVQVEGTICIRMKPSANGY